MPVEPVHDVRKLAAGGRRRRGATVAHELHREQLYWFSGRRASADDQLRGAGGAGPHCALARTRQRLCVLQRDYESDSIALRSIETIERMLPAGGQIT